jgi:hypothetical protein
MSWCSGVEGPPATDNVAREDAEPTDYVPDAAVQAEAGCWSHVRAESPGAVTHVGR